MMKKHYYDCMGLSIVFVKCIFENIKKFHKFIGIFSFGRKSMKIVLFKKILYETIVSFDSKFFEHLMLSFSHEIKRICIPNARWWYIEKNVRASVFNRR